MAQTAMAEFYVRRASQTSSASGLRAPSVLGAPAPAIASSEAGYGPGWVGTMNRKFARSAVR